MKLLVIGAAGKLGSELVLQGVRSGHQVTALVRRPERLAGVPEGVVVVRGDLLDITTLRSALSGQDAVLAGVAPKPGFGDKAPLFAPGSRNLVSAMENAGPARLLWVTSAAVDPQDLAATAPLFRLLIEPLLLKGVYADAAASEDVLQSSMLDWTAVRPTQLTDGPLVGRYRIDTKHTPQGGRSISRADVAHFMLGEIERRDFVRGTPVLSY